MINPIENFAPAQPSVPLARHYRLTKFSAIFILAFVTICGVRVFATEKPNIIFILTDDMGYGDVGCYGGKFVPTPNIDRMANEGKRFTQYYSASPICSPSRTGILTGQYPARWKILTFLQDRAGNRAAHQVDFLDPKAPSIARALHEAGYATAHIGKWHMGGGRDVTNAPPFSAYAFDEHVSTFESPEPAPDLTSTNWVWSAQDKIKRWNRTAYFVDKTLDFLGRHKNQPCYVNLWPDDVHTPWVPRGTSDDELKKKDLGKEEFRAVLAEYDVQIGRFFEGLKKLGMDKNTLVIFASDNGPMPTFRGERSGGFRDGKGSLHEGGIRMPFIARWPGRISAGEVDKKTVFHAVDLFPTFCKIGGGSLPKNVTFDGEDLSAVLLGKPATRKKLLFWEFKSFTPPKEAGPSPTLAVRDGDWKLLVNNDGTDTELFDLSKDPGETNNLQNENQKVAQRLKKEVLAWRKSVSSK